MACVSLNGAEIGIDNPAGGSPSLDGAFVSGAFTRDTSTKRSGNAAWKADSTGSNLAANGNFDNYPASVNTTYFFRQYFNVSQLPGSTVRIFFPSNFPIKLTSGGKIQLFNNDTSTQIGSDSAATITTGVWYRLELQVVIGVSNITAVELRLDGVTVASDSGLSVTNGSSTAFGWLDPPGANKVIYFDDGKINDNTGAANNSWCGDGKLILMTPTSDSQRGVWTAGAGGTTNLWDALNNIPPAGLASGSATNTSQIKSSSTGSQTSANEYRGDCGTYLAAGIGANDTINVVRVTANHGEEVSTGTKTVLVYAVSNPATAGTSGSAGSDAGAEGTWNSNWGWTHDAAQNAPSVTKSSSLVLGIRRTDSGTRLADCDLLAAYVEYTPAVVSVVPDVSNRPLLMSLSRP